MIHCNNATWDFLIAIDDSFSEAFVYGGPMGVSCDISAFSAEYKKRWGDVITQYKKHSDFYKNATARILVDSDSVVAIEYADENLNVCVLQVFTKTTYARELVLYPAVCKASKYRCGSVLLFGKDVQENGILIRNLTDNCCQTITLIKE